MLEWLVDTLSKFEHSSQSQINSISYVNNSIELSFELMEDFAKYRLYIDELNDGPSLNFWCFSPSIAFRDLSTARSVILTSGTLSPFHSVENEFGTKFPIQLQSSHVIKENQLFCGVLTKGPCQVSLNSTYENRNSDHYKRELGLVIANLCKAIPEGFVVFFSSYAVMSSCLKFWEDIKIDTETNISIMERIQSKKQVFIEPKSQISVHISQLLNEFKVASLMKSSLSNGALLFAVCRGKISEGLDFSDSMCRAVLLAGLPFPNLTSPRIKLKKEYLDINKSGLSGEAWYHQSAIRAINQAIGRVIRHRNDYGAIILCDERFAWPKNKFGLSKWIHPFLKEMRGFGDLNQQLIRFFRESKELNLVPHSIQAVQAVPFEDDETLVINPRKKAKVDQEARNETVHSVNSSTDTDLCDRETLDKARKSPFGKFILSLKQFKQIDQTAEYKSLMLEIMPQMKKIAESRGEKEEFSLLMYSLDTLESFASQESSTIEQQIKVCFSNILLFNSWDLFALCIPASLIRSLKLWIPGYNSDQTKILSKLSDSLEDTSCYFRIQKLLGCVMLTFPIDSNVNQSLGRKRIEEYLRDLVILFRAMRPCLEEAQIYSVLSTLLPEVARSDFERMLNDQFGCVIDLEISNLLDFARGD
jgi:hypothetical protein